MPTTTESGLDLKQRWTTFQTEHPAMPRRTAASRLDASEAELVATGCGDHVTRLTRDWESLLIHLEDLGPVVAHTRNDAAVHEKMGVYRNVTFPDVHNMGMVLDDDIDLRLFMDRWAVGFAVEAAANDGRQTAHPSLQFFAPDGTPVHTVRLTADSDRDAYRALVEAHRHDNQSIEQPVAAPSDDSELQNPNLDTEAFLTAWGELEDTHDFFPLLEEYNVSRRRAFQVGEGHFTRRVPDGGLRTTLQAAAEQDMPIMVFVGSPGCIQIHTGPVHNPEASPPCYKVLDADFQLRVDEDRIAQSWVVKKPTTDGPVHSLELMDDDGDIIVRLFGKRKPGQPERTDWRTLLEHLPSQG